MNMQIGGSTAAYSSRSYPYFHLSQYNDQRPVRGSVAAGGVDAFFERIRFIAANSETFRRLGVTITADAQVVCHPHDFVFIRGLMEATCISGGSSQGMHDEEH